MKNVLLALLVGVTSMISLSAFADSNNPVNCKEALSLLTENSARYGEAQTVQKLVVLKMLNEQGERYVGNITDIEATAVVRLQRALDLANRLCK